FRELLAQIRQSAEQFCSFLSEPVGIGFERLRIRLGESVSNGTDRTLKLHAAIKIVFKQTHSQGPQLWDNLAAHHSERLRRVTGDEHALSFREQVTNKISDGVRVSRTGRSLNEDSA